ncbi:hypothetical protein P4V54_09465 [Brevibacillus nitrificans]|uniref:hypothetical protein n=1 Tax=Brevibacillus nitrificans TaxID=651560 RepID=UPI002E1E8552|nr:hypothetical protein [Brevibacillus nitrificans]
MDNYVFVTVMPQTQTFMQWLNLLAIVLIIALTVYGFRNEHQKKKVIDKLSRLVNELDEKIHPSDENRGRGG